jgi:hypothetical protein
MVFFILELLKVLIEHVKSISSKVILISTIELVDWVVLNHKIRGSSSVLDSSRSWVLKIIISRE